MAARLLRKTGEAIKHSPGALRRAISGSNTYKLSLEEAKDPFKVGLSFYVTYIGCETMEPVAVANKETVRKVDAIVNSVITAKRTAPAKRLVLVVTTKQLSVMDRKDALNVTRTPLYSVAYAGSHPVHDKVFVFLETKENGTSTVCHVMLCESTQMTKALVRVTAKAFQNAFLDWQGQQKRQRSASGGKELEKDAMVSPSAEIPNNMVLARRDDEAGAAKTEESAAEKEPVPGNDDADDDDTTGDPVEKAEKLARHRSFYRRSCIITNPDVLSTGALEIKPEEFDLDEVKEFVQTLENATCVDTE